MKKKIFISIALLLGCEDKTNVSPLVGSWNMVEISGGTFIKLNKTQKIYYQDKKEGIIQVKKYKNGVLKILLIFGILFGIFQKSKVKKEKRK